VVTSDHYPGKTKFTFISNIQQVIHHRGQKTDHVNKKSKYETFCSCICVSTHVDYCMRHAKDTRISHHTVTRSNKEPQRLSILALNSIVETIFQLWLSLEVTTTLKKTAADRWVLQCARRPSSCYLGERSEQGMDTSSLSAPGTLSHKYTHTSQSC